MWGRGDLGRPQHISFSSSDDVIVSTDDNVTYILGGSDGSMLARFEKVDRLIESGWRSFVFQSREQMEIRGSDGFVRVVPRQTFDELAVAFSPSQVCISESGGPVRCVEIESGVELWRYSSNGRHVVQLCYRQAEDTFVAIEVEYEHGGRRQLLRFDASSGRMRMVSEIDSARETAFCFDGSRIVTAGGSMIDSATGVVIDQLWTSP
jgi:hypothetical protein